jgi:aerobic-type carbon monoxide dehydrogenase small subunit (CoxS/CutS family)
MIGLTINEKVVLVDAPGDTPLLWVLHEWLDLMGTKYGCGIGVCARARYMSMVWRSIPV